MTYVVLLTNLATQEREEASYLVEEKRSSRPRFRPGDLSEATKYYTKEAADRAVREMAADRYRGEVHLVVRGEVLPVEEPKGAALLSRLRKVYNEYDEKQAEKARREKEKYAEECQKIYKQVVQMLFAAAGNHRTQVEIPNALPPEVVAMLESDKLYVVFETTDSNARTRVIIPLDSPATGSDQKEQLSLAPKTCLACAHCFVEPDDDFTCGHPDAGSMGTYVKRAAAPGGHCGPELPKFQQHPLRLPNGEIRE